MNLTTLLWLVISLSIYTTLITASDDQDVFDTDDGPILRVPQGRRLKCPKLRNMLKNGVVKLRNNGRIAKFTCYNSYTLHGKTFATCLRGQWNYPLPICLKSGCTSMVRPLNGRMKSLYNDGVEKFSCDPGYVLKGTPAVYCDGHTWNHTAPPTCEVVTTKPPTSCPFEEENLCYWSNDDKDDFDWWRQQFATPSGHVGTGPSHDHTPESGLDGYYMYIEASTPRKENDTARLFSPVYTPNFSPGCFVMWYHMYGANTGTLRVFIRGDSQVLAELQPVWQLQGEVGNQWHRATIDLSQMTSSFQIVIEGVVGNGYVGDIAIDDVSIRNISCTRVQESEQSGEMIGTCENRCSDFPAGGNVTCECSPSCEPSANCCQDYWNICVRGKEGQSTIPNDESVQVNTSSTETKIPLILTASTPIPAISSSSSNQLTTTTLKSTTSESPTTLKPTTTTTVRIITTTPKPTTTTPKPTTTTPKPTTTTPKPTTTTPKPTTTTPKPTTTTPEPTTTTPKPTTTTPKPTTTTFKPTTTTPKPTTTTLKPTTTTPKPTTTTTKPTTTTPKPTTTTTEPTTTLKPTTPKLNTPKPTTPNPTTTTPKSTTTPTPTTTTTPKTTTPTPKPTTTTQKPITTTPKPITSTKMYTTVTPEPKTVTTLKLTYTTKSRLKFSTTQSTIITTPTTSKTITHDDKEIDYNSWEEYPDHNYESHETIPHDTNHQPFVDSDRSRGTIKPYLVDKRIKESSQSSLTTWCIVLGVTFVLVALALTLARVARNWRRQRKLDDELHTRFLTNSEEIQFS